MGDSSFGHHVRFGSLKIRASSIPKLTVLFVTAYFLLSQFALDGGPQAHPELEKSPDVVHEWNQIINWTDPQDGEVDVPLDMTVTVAFLSNNTSWDGYTWSVTPDAGGWMVTESWDVYGNLILEMHHSVPFQRCTMYAFNFTFYDGLNPVDYYEFSFTTICSFPQPPAPPLFKYAVLGGLDNKDIVLSWNLSTDDGAGDDDVANYAVHHSESYHWGGQGYEFLANVSAGTGTFTHTLAGDGDWSNHFYYVQANDTEGDSSWKGQVGKFVRYLEKGKRTASIPLIQHDTTLEVVLQTLEGSYKHVRYYKSADQSGHWKSYWTFKTYRTLFEINHTMGFWIDMTKDDHLVVAGLVPDFVNIRLYHGWNFVGYPSFINRTVDEALYNIDWKMIDGYGDTPPYHLKHLDSSDMMTAGEGY
ncbi:MAG: hypothetical protein KAU99_03835, partial [Thermoplasmata archaeon]|nr:hypothetical protein [Thermoplasmata archaeon]